MVQDHDAARAAVAADDVERLRALLRARPALLSERLDESGRTALHLAAHADAKRVADALLAAGADFYARDDNGQLPLDLPAGQEMNGVREHLRAMNRSRNDFLGAVGRQEIDRVKALLAQDPSLVAARDIGDGWSALMIACHFGNEKMARVLVNAGSRLDATDFNNGQDAVLVCAEKDSAACLTVLIEAGAELSRTATIMYGQIPMRMNALHVASWKGHAEVVRLLIAKKVDVNTRVVAYPLFTPLHLAATDGHAAVVALLLEAGTDAHARDGRRGITALQMAEAGKHEAAAALLQSR